MPEKDKQIIVQPEPVPTYDHRQEGLDQTSLDLIDKRLADRKPKNLCPNGSFGDW